MSTWKEDGYCIVDALDSSEVTYLNELCVRYLHSQDGEFISSSHFLDRTTSDFINDEIHRLLKDKMYVQFPDLELLGGTLATKLMGKNNLVAHQDWSIVDETLFSSYNLWIALVDTDKENGTLGVVKGSHLWCDSVRGLNIPNPYDKYTDKFLKIGEEPRLKAGQAILYDHRLIHYSRPNRTRHPRNVAIVGMKPQQAALRVSFSMNGIEVLTYAVEEQDFYRFDVNNVIANRMVIGKNKLEYKVYTWREIEKLAGVKKRNWFFFR